MPHIDFNELFVGGKWSSKLIILMGWDIFKGTLTSEYQVHKKAPFISRSIETENAWHIIVNHQHSKLGKYKSQIIFDSNKYGFLELNNEYHDGSKIIMKLIEVR